MVDTLEVALCAITSKVRWDNQAREKKEVAEREEKGEEAEEGQVCNRCMRRWRLEKARVQQTRILMPTLGTEMKQNMYRQPNTIHDQII